MRKILIQIIGASLFFFGVNVLAGDLQCYGYTSATSYFQCGTYGNCTWWSAYMRSDLAAAGIHGNGGEWYDNANNLGFDVGSQPRVGAVVVFSNGLYGHVAYVTSLGDNGSFSVSEMDSTGLLGSGVQYATYSPNGGGTYNRNGGSTSWVLKGFIYRRLQGTNLYCDSINSIWGICWTPTSNDVSCQGGGDWKLYDFEQGSVIRVSTNQYCLKEGGVGGGIPTDPPDAQSQTPEAVNLTLDFDVLDQNATYELYAGQNQLQKGQVIRLNTQLEAVHGNTKDWMDPGKDTIETDFYVQVNEGDWSKISRQYTQASNLDEGETHTEHVLYTIPQNAKTISFYVKTDAEKELTETNENDNVSRIETFQVDNFTWLIPILNLILED